MSPPDGGPLPLTGLYPWEVADSLWLAANHPGLATDEDLADSGREDAEPSEPAPAQQDDDRVTEPEQPDRDEEPQPEQQRPPGPEPLPPSARDDGPPPVAGPGTRHTLAPTAELPAASQLRTAVGPGAGDRPRATV